MSNALAIIEHQLQPLRPMFDQLLRPTGVPAERIIRSVLISCERTPRLLECTPVSVIQAATTGAVLGLEADGHTGQGFLAPFRQKGTLKAQWLTGYKGFSTLAARVGLTVNGEVVREGDEFDFELGSAGYVRHKPALGSGQNRRIIGAWATASAPDRAPIVVVMDIDEILAIKARSQAAKRDHGDEAFAPWNDPAVGFPAMAGKTAKRRLARSLPLSVYQAAARIDEAHEEQGHHAFMHPEKGVVIDGEVSPPPLEQPKGPSVAALVPRAFIVHRGREETRCSTIEEWRGRLVTAISTLPLYAARRLREINAAVFDEYRPEFPRDVAAVEAAFTRRLGREQHPGGGATSQEKGGTLPPVSPETRERTAHGAPAASGVREIVPAKVRGAYDWRSYCSHVRRAFAKTAPGERQAFRNGQAQYMTLLRNADRPRSDELLTWMADVERGDTP